MNEFHGITHSRCLLPETCFVDMGSDIIPEEDEEGGELYDDVDHPLPTSGSLASSQPIDDEIYEELPGIYSLVIHLGFGDFS